MSIIFNQGTGVTLFCELRVRVVDFLGVNLCVVFTELLSFISDMSDSEIDLFF
jgi:hypothetical protein